MRCVLVAKERARAQEEQNTKIVHTYFLILFFILSLSLDVYCLVSVLELLCLPAMRKA